jgi:hypothetical protein
MCVSQTQTSEAGTRTGGFAGALAAPPLVRGVPAPDGRPNPTRPDRGTGRYPKVRLGATGTAPIRSPSQQDGPYP